MNKLVWISYYITEKVVDKTNKNFLFYRLNCPGMDRFQPNENNEFHFFYHFTPAGKTVEISRRFLFYSMPLYPRRIYLPSHQRGSTFTSPHTYPRAFPSFHRCFFVRGIVPFQKKTFPRHGTTTPSPYAFLFCTVTVDSIIRTAEINLRSGLFKRTGAGLQEHAVQWKINKAGWVNVFFWIFYSASCGYILLHSVLTRGLEWRQLLVSPCGACLIFFLIILIGCSAGSLFLFNFLLHLSQKCLAIIVALYSNEIPFISKLHTS